MSNQRNAFFKIFGDEDVEGRVPLFKDTRREHKRKYVLIKLRMEKISKRIFVIGLDLQPRRISREMDESDCFETFASQN